MEGKRLTGIGRAACGRGKRALRAEMSSRPGPKPTQVPGPPGTELGPLTQKAKGGDRSDEHLARLTLAPDRPPRQPSDTCKGREVGGHSPRILPFERTNPSGPAEVPAIRSSRTQPRAHGGAAARISPASTFCVVGPPSITWRSSIFAPQLGQCHPLTSKTLHTSWAQVARGLLPGPFALLVRGPSSMPGGPGT